jgi:hypothetical protein
MPAMPWDELTRSEQRLLISYDQANQMLINCQGMSAIEERAVIDVP